ncbi:DUF502 domain-containing protein [sulfur-oxidizing endosymbiont of Gigantopelta aegis]|uniref:DUF502 domain-containing protein n=1 Tax=sulfur-oxidizing endosymbiont of Gigantopelta aegis TaxID=2794934 RepID=UPI0018DC975F|nr:DUF502 domain-containing protein [sulfur-oxidizing endosymbiont of Gigantopelta aegis]
MIEAFSLKKFFKAALFGGIVVILPVAIFAFFLKWLFKMITNLIQPLSHYALTTYQLPEIVADLLVVTLIILTCFVVGFMVQTSIGNFLHNLFDDMLSKLAPGYRMVKEVVVQIFGQSENSPFANGQVAKVRIFGEDCPTEVTALVTDQHPDGRYTVFMPTGPNPTSGNIYHVLPSQVTLCPDVPLDSAMRTVIACGAGSGELFSAEAKNSPEQ